MVLTPATCNPVNYIFNGCQDLTWEELDWGLDMTKFLWQTPSDTIADVDWIPVAGPSGEEYVKLGPSGDGVTGNLVWAWLLPGDDAVADTPYTVHVDVTTAQGRKKRYVFEITFIAK